MILRLYPSHLHGSVTVPPSKSLLHRELICRRLAGQTTPLPPDAADDVRYTAAALALLDTPHPTVYCGDSGSTLRFLLPLFMALGRTDAVFTGSPRLLRRPIPADLGLRPTDAGLTLTRPLRGGTWTLSAAATSQVVSGLLMALPLLPDSSDIMLTEQPVSRPYLDMTCHVLRHHGVTVTPTPTGYHIDGGQTYRPAPLLTAPDWSAAAFWLALSRVQQMHRGGTEEIEVLSPAPIASLGDELSISPDIALENSSFSASTASPAGKNAFVSAHPYPEDKCPPPVVHDEVKLVRKPEQNGTNRKKTGSKVLPDFHGDSRIISYLDDFPSTIDLSDTPDLLMPLALCAALLAGRTTRFTGCGFLRGKESDRPAAVAQVLNTLGAQVVEEPESLVITGVSGLHGGCVDSFGDHRIAMLAGCAAMLLTDGSVTLTGAEQVAKSYPDFWKELAAIGGRMEVLAP